MREKLVQFRHWFGEAFGRMLRRYPIELVLILCGCAGCAALYHIDDPSDLFEARLTIVPLVTAWVLTVNLLVGQSSWRKLYWVCWMTLIPLFLWEGLPEWINQTVIRMTWSILIPLALLMAGCARQNVRFVSDALTWLRSGVLALFFPSVTFGLFCAILYSTTYIFGLEGQWITDATVYAAILCEALCVPVLLIMMADSWLGSEVKGHRILAVLLNYIVTPALLVYAAILYLYILKIVFTWSLPLGGVAYMVFGFTIFTVLVKALQEILERRLYDWFFNRFSLYLLPPLVLFWVGVAERVGQYGLTEDRVWLVACGAVMTFCIGLFLSRRTGRYLYVALLAFVVFAALAYVPAWHPERIAMRSQAARAERIARRLGVMGEDGKISIAALAQADTARWREYGAMNDAFEYIEYAPGNSDTLTLLQSRFGFDSPQEFLDLLPPAIAEAITNGEFSECGSSESAEVYFVCEPANRVFPLAGYREMITGLAERTDETGYALENDTLQIGLGASRLEFRIAGRELIETQLRRIGASKTDRGTYDADLLDERASDFLTYEDRELTIIFSNIMFECDSVVRLQNLNVSMVLLR